MSGDRSTPADTRVSAGGNQDLYLGIAISAFGLALIFWVIPNQVNDAGSFGLPPSLAPRLLAWLMVGLGIIISVQSLLRHAANPARNGLDWPDVKFLLICVASVAVTLLIMRAVGNWMRVPYAGFFVAGPIGLISFTFLHTGAPAWAYAFNAIVVPALVYAAFWWGLSIPLP